MKKKIFISLGLFIALLIGAVIVLPILFKDEIIQKVKDEANKNLNAKLDFGGFDLSLLSTFPDFKLSLNDLSIVGTDLFNEDTLIAVKSLELNVNLMSVIKGEQYQINAIVLDHPHILAKVLKDGKANWDITKPSPETEQSGAEEPSSFKMTLKKFEIKNGNIIYDDASLGFKTALVDMNHNLSGDFTQDNFTLETETTIEQFDMIYEGIKYLNKVKTTIKMDMEADMPNFKFTFKENEIQLNRLFLGLDGFVAMPGDDIDMDFKYFAKKTEFKNILSLIPAVYTKDFESVKTSGTLALDGYLKGKYNETSMPGFGTKLLVENAMFQYPDLPQAVKNIQVNVNVDNKDGVPDHTVIDIKRFYFEMANNPVDIKMLIKTPVSDANIDGVIKGKLILSSIKDIVPMEEGESMNGTIVADVTLKGRMSSVEKGQYDKFTFLGQIMAMDMNYKSKDAPYGINISKAYLNFSPKFVELSTFESKIGKSDINASGKIENFLEYMFKEELLTGTFNMNSKLMDLNEFMEDSDAPATASAAPAEETPMSVIEVPGNVNFTLNTAITKLIYDNIEMANVSGAVKIADQKVSLNNLKMNLLGGSMVMNGGYETRDAKNPGIDFDLDITNFDIQKTATTFNTVEKMAPVAKNCHGKFSTILKLAGKLDKAMEPVLNSLNGKGKLSTSGVVLQNFAPVNKIADALKMDQYKKLALNNINISYEFKDGKVTTEPFDIKLGNTMAKVGGSTHFDQTIDYVWNLEIPRSEFGGAANTVLTGLVSQANSKGANFTPGEKVKLNVLVGGTVTNPTVKVNLKDAASGVVDDLKDKAKEELDKKKAELEAKAKEEAERLKNEATNKANAEIDKAKAEAEKAKNEAEAKARAEAEKAKKEAEEKAKAEAKKKLKGLIKP